MKITIASILMLIFLETAPCIAQTYNIHGIVTDTGGVPIPGAVVGLENVNFKTVTANDGRFEISGTAIEGNRWQNYKNQNIISCSIRNGHLQLILKQRLRVEIQTFNMQGKVLSSTQQKLDAGSSIMPLPWRGPGVVLYRINAGENTIMIQEVNIVAKASRIALACSVQESNSLARRNATTVKINDVLFAIKPGYLDYRMPIDSSEKDEIKIKMIICADTVRDIDGNLYQAVRIGNQVWTAENLRVTRLNTGAEIRSASPSGPDWGNLKAVGYCFYQNNTNNQYRKKFGALYNGYTAISKNIAPAGWHVPSNEEWDTLQNYLINNGFNWDGSNTGNFIAKSLAAMTDWPGMGSQGDISNDLTKNNRSGFCAMPSGYRSPNELGLFYEQGSVASFWSSTSISGTDAYYRILKSYNSFLSEYSIGLGWGYSIRLVRDR